MGGNSPGQKTQTIACRQSPTKLRTKHVQAIQPFTALLQQAHDRVGSYSPQLKITIIGLTISRCERHLESRSGQDRSPVQGPPGTHWSLFGIRGENIMNWGTSSCPRDTGSPGPPREAAREWGWAERGPLPRSLRSVGNPPTPFSEGAATNKHGGAREK